MNPSQSESMSHKCARLACNRQIRTGWECRVCGRTGFCAHCCGNKADSKCTCVSCSALSNLQRDTLTALTREWSHAPGGTTTATLLSLRDRGLIESRRTPGTGHPPRSEATFDSVHFQWKRVK